MPACVQAPMLLNVRRLTALTELRLIGAANLVGDAAMALLAATMPPDLAVLQASHEQVSWPATMRDFVWQSHWPHFGPECNKALGQT